MKLIFALRVALFSVALAGFTFALEIKSLEADFIQKISNDDGGIEYKGRLQAKITESKKGAESSAYWKYEKPMKKDIFVHKNKVIIYEPNLNQAIVSKEIQLDFLKIINSAKKDGEKLISVVNDMEFVVTMEGELPLRVEYTDNLDNKIIITLENVVLNGDIKDSVFDFKIPKGVDTIFQ